MIKAQRVGQTIVCIVGEKMYQKVFDTDKEVLAVFEQALNTDEGNDEELKALKIIFEPGLTAKEVQDKEEFEAEQIEIELKQDLLSWMENIKSLGDEHFEVKGISLYMKGIGITIPEFLAIEFEKRRSSEEDLSSMMNFWRLCSLNSDPRCREDLYKFLINNNMVVTPSGYFLAYRNANIKQEGNQKLNEFVGDQFIKIKNWKKSTKNYVIFDNISNNGEDKYICKPTSLLAKIFSKDDVNEADYDKLGTVQELYDQLQKDREDTTIYTDAYSGSTKIIIGQPVSIPRSGCNSDPDVSCSRGLHLGSTNFMSKNYFGSVGLVCLCNPMKVVAVPYANGQKLRTSEYLPIGIADYGDDNRLIPVETATFEYDYAEHTEEELEELLNTASFESLKEHKIIPQEMRYEDFRDIVSEFTVSTEVMKKTIEKRIQTV